MYQILCVPQAEKQSFPSTNLDRLAKTGGYLQLRSFTFLLPNLYLVAVVDVVDDGSWKLAVPNL